MPAKPALLPHLHRVWQRQEPYPRGAGDLLEKVNDGEAEAGWQGYILFLLIRAGKREEEPLRMIKEKTPHPKPFLRVMHK